MRELTLNIYKISRCTHIYYARELRKLGVSMGQFPFLIGVSENDGISQENLSSMLRISKSTTTAMIRQLLEKNLVSREVDPADRRNFRLHSTDGAHVLIPKIYAIIDACHEILLQGLTPEEQDLLDTLAAKARRNAEAASRTRKKRKAKSAKL